MTMFACCFFNLEYMYRVEAVNDAGSVLSDWATGRTREGGIFTYLYPQEKLILYDLYECM